MLLMAFIQAATWGVHLPTDKTFIWCCWWRSSKPQHEGFTSPLTRPSFDAVDGVHPSRNMRGSPPHWQDLHSMLLMAFIQAATWGVHLPTDKTFIWWCWWRSSKPQHEGFTSPLTRPSFNAVDGVHPSRNMRGSPPHWQDLYSMLLMAFIQAATWGVHFPTDMTFIRWCWWRSSKPQHEGFTSPLTRPSFYAVDGVHPSRNIGLPKYAGSVQHAIVYHKGKCSHHWWIYCFLVLLVSIFGLFFDLILFVLLLLKREVFL